MDNPVKLSTLGTQDHDKQNKITSQYMLDTTLCTTNTSNVNKACALLQTTGGKDEPNNLIGQHSHTHTQR